jgi:acyl transferase domain-containing protein
VLLRHMVQGPRSVTAPLLIAKVDSWLISLQAGDVREIASLDATFGKYHSKANPLTISSIKGNVGHCEAASGAASLAKLILMMRKKELLPQAGLKTLNPRLTAFKDGRLTVPREKSSWSQSQNAPRRALLNNFGAAGSNAALLLEEYRQHTINSREHRSAYPFNISARSRDALQMTINSYGQFLSAKAESNLILEDVCYTATARREIYEYRLSIPCSSVDDLRRELTKFDSAKVPSAAPKRNLVFTFSGQGCIQVGMGRELMSSLLFRDLINQCDRIVLCLGFKGIAEFITSDGTEHTFRPGSVEYMVISQCACIALEYSLAKLLMSYGVAPDYMIGHR